MAALWLMLLVSMVAVGLGAEGGAESGEAQTKEGAAVKQEETKKGGESVEQEGVNKEGEAINKDEEDEEGDKKLDPNVPLYAHCCMADQVLPLVFPAGVDKCRKFMPISGGNAMQGAEKENGGVDADKRNKDSGESGADVEKGKVDGEERGASGEKSGEDSGCLVECMLKVNGLLDEKKSIKEEQLRLVLLNGVDAETRTSLSGVLDTCFTLLKEKYGQDQAEQTSSTCDRVNEFFSCLTKRILEDCPASFWRMDIPKCRKNAPKKAVVAAAIDQDEY